MAEEQKHVRAVVRVFLTAGQQVELWFDSLERAHDGVVLLRVEAGGVMDDFGHWLEVPPENIAGIAVTDYAADLEGQVDIAWKRQQASEKHNARVQKTNELLGRMPMVMRPNGPPIIQG